MVFACARVLPDAEKGQVCLVHHAPAILFWGMSLQPTTETF